MIKIAKIAYRNLLRYSRRTMLTSMLVIIGIVAVLLFIAIAGSFKQFMVGQITDSMLGHLQVHRKGYVASIDNSPLNLNLKAKQVVKLKEILNGNDKVTSFSTRLKFGGMLSNFTETSNIRLNGINPAMEFQTVPLLSQRVTGKNDAVTAPSLNQGEIWVPETLAKGLKLKIGTQVVLIATNQNGSVNGLPLVVSGMIGSMTGPGGRDGYLNIKDAYQLLRIKGEEVNEVAIRLKSLDVIKPVFTDLKQQLSGEKNKNGKPVFEIHTWEKLSPFSNIAKIIDLLTLFVKVILIAIVLVSIMNVMLMAVYERIREIGTIAAIGTSPRKIWTLFLMEGFFLGFFGAVVGSFISLGIIQFLNWKGLAMSFGRQNTLILTPTIAISEVLITALIVIGISALASLGPAVKASRLEPVDALRHF
ncbi:MAG: ABC transporter permease [Deltaproteobacteria bacterium]|jgi:putative ABC transport system permease protein|nr:ABC transporter permease [Deltaproteobacteria bacterium]MBT4263815.1 ABC transporter permease [Deltaproteobacteria bacterium]MBT4640504.1 ABC transporter permease [Deltaproteobacteria bacterium]MBT6502260.1 ABC transporter permease [Deltaproteobacteria bacterium]MBT6612393.1 ABC transporter permease [Deltaproteobacteria bacterium]